MRIKNKKSIIKYWISLAEKDIEVMDSLFKSSHYPYALFIGHLATEKILKAYYVDKKEKHPPFIHDLARLAVESGLTFSEEEKTFLDAVSQFNIEARYPDIKLSFYERANRDFTSDYINKIKEFYQWVRLKIQL